MKDMGFICSPIGKIPVVASYNFDISGWHYNKYRVVIDVLEKISVDFEECEVLIERYFFGEIPFLVVNKNNIFILSRSRKRGEIEVIISEVE